jgi:hypothetical protein
MAATFRALGNERLSFCAALRAPLAGFSAAPAFGYHS